MTEGPTAFPQGVTGPIYLFTLVVTDGKLIQGEEPTFPALSLKRQKPEEGFQIKRNFFPPPLPAGAVRIRNWDLLLAKAYAPPLSCIRNFIKIEAAFGPVFIQNTNYPMEFTATRCGDGH